MEYTWEHILQYSPLAEITSKKHYVASQLSKIFGGQMKQQSILSSLSLVIVYMHAPSSLKSDNTTKDM